MTNDDIVLCWTLQMEFLQLRYDLEQAKRLDSILWPWLGFCGLRMALPDRQPYQGVSKPTLLTYLNVRTSMYLNQMFVQEVEATLRAFEQVIRPEWRYDHALVYHFILKAELLHRQGRNKEAVEILDGILPHTSHPEDLALIHSIKGSIESDLGRYVWPLAIFNDHSKALGYAEQTEDKSRIAKTYAQLGHALHRQYPALALSMQWKAQVMAEQQSDRHLVFGTKLQRAYSDIQMLFLHGNQLKKPELFREDAEQIVHSIKRDELPTDDLKTFYDETSAYVLGTDEPMERALEYYQSHHAYDKVYQMAENIGGRAVFQHDDDKVRRMMDICIDAARKMNDQVKLDRAVQGLKLFNDSRNHELEGKA